MPISISNLAWPSAIGDKVFERLVSLGVAGVEVAPTRLAPWEALTGSMLSSYRSQVESAGLVVSSLQAILFGRPELQLLGDGEAFDTLLEHMRLVAGVGSTLGASVLVFGSPRNRLRGEMNLDRAWATARERFRRLGEVAIAGGVIIGIEPVPPIYGGDFLTSWSEVLQLVLDVAHPGVRVHLDTACVALGGDNIGDAVVQSAKVLCHFHAAQPRLANFEAPLPDHLTAAEALHRIDYGGWISIEMLEPPGDVVAEIERAVLTVRSFYK